MKKSEHTEQVALFNWTKYQLKKYQELELLHAIPNGGLRHPRVAKKLKAEGVKSGVPDLFLPVPKNNYYGLYIEMKFNKNKTTKNQDWWLSKLTEQGFLCKVCYGFEEAKNIILTYLR